MSAPFSSMCVAHVCRSRWHDATRPVTCLIHAANRPDKRVRDFQTKQRRPMIEQRQKQQAANCTARGERDRLRQEQKRRAAGIPPRGAKEALDEATGYRDAFGRLTDPG